MLFDYLSVRLNGPEAVGRKLSLNFDFTDLGKAYGLTVANGVLNYGPPTTSPDVALRLSKSTLDAIQLKQVSMQEAVQRGDIVLQGRREAFQEFLELLDSFPHWFNIVTP